MQKTPVETLKIKNFKSIKDLVLPCRRVNIFIGEPNTGKSNILEAIGLISHVSYGPLSNFVRFETMMDLYYDRNLEDNITVSFDEYTIQIVFKNGTFIGNFFFTDTNGNTATLNVFNYNYGGGGSLQRGRFGRVSQILEMFKFYRFSKLKGFPDTSSDFLLPPHGQNLLHILLTRKDLRKTASDLFKKFGYRLLLTPSEGKIEVQKDLEDVAVSIPYTLTSDTLERIVFYLAAMYSNKDSVLSFEEPEAHAFPYYTKYLAERIALDQTNNQYFIATHNPYFLGSVIEKTPKSEIATFVTYFEDYQTKIKLLSESEIERALAMGPDFFFNIDHFLEKDSAKGN
jgi:AAA15 family ATPase/GTPase